MKGTTTEQKLKVVKAYLGEEDKAPRLITAAYCCVYNTRRIQVVNYLTALSRGGLIEPLPDEFNWNDIKIRR